jgi:hypothetical protein
MGGERYEAVRRRVVRRLRKRAFFWLNVVAFIVFSLATRRDIGIENTLWLWFGVIFVHFIYAFEVWQRIVDRMVQRELGKSGAAEIKRKNEQVMLGEDGELVPLVHVTDLEEGVLHQHKGQ